MSEDTLHKLKGRVVLLSPQWRKPLWDRWMPEYISADEILPLWVMPAIILLDCLPVPKWTWYTHAKEIPNIWYGRRRCCCMCSHFLKVDGDQKNMFYNCQKLLHHVILHHWYELGNGINWNKLNQLEPREQVGARPRVKQFKNDILICTNWLFGVQEGQEAGMWTVDKQGL